MPAQQIQAHELDPGPLRSDVEKRYIVINAGDNEAAAYLQVEAAAPAQYLHPNGSVLQLSNIELDQYTGNGIWYGTATYSRATGELTHDTSPPPTPHGDAPFVGGMSFSTVGATLHITQSLSTIDSVKAGGGAPPDNKKAIGVHGDKDQIDGVDITVPKLEFSLKRRRSYVSLNYLSLLMDFTGVVNADLFLGFEPGEVLFLGANGEIGDKGWDITYSFSVAPNEANVDVGNGMIFTAKKGWEYIWCSYSPAVSNNALTRHPIYAYLEQVYEEDNFSELQLFS